MELLIASDEEYVGFVNEAAQLIRTGPRNVTREEHQRLQDILDAMHSYERYRDLK